MQFRWLIRETTEDVKQLGGQPGCQTVQNAGQWESGGDLATLGPVVKTTSFGGQLRGQAKKFRSLAGWPVAEEDSQLTPLATGAAEPSAQSCLLTTEAAQWDSHLTLLMTGVDT